MLVDILKRIKMNPSHTEVYRLRPPALARLKPLLGPLCPSMDRLAGRVVVKALGKIITAFALSCSSKAISR